MEKNKKKLFVILVLYIFLMISLFAIYKLVDNYGVTEFENKEYKTTGWLWWKKTTVETSVEIEYHYYLIVVIVTLGLIFTAFFISGLKKVLSGKLLNKKE